LSISESEFTNTTFELAAGPVTTTGSSLEYTLKYRNATATSSITLRISDTCLNLKDILVKDIKAFRYMVNASTAVPLQPYLKL
jgi:hypothetical protein